MRSIAAFVDTALGETMEGPVDVKKMFFDLGKLLVTTVNLLKLETAQVRHLINQPHAERECLN